MRIGSALSLLAIGAILAFAIDIDPTPVAGIAVRWDSIGLILMLVGLVGLAWSIAVLNSMRRRRDATFVEQPPVTRSTVVERETWVDR